MHLAGADPGKRMVGGSVPDRLFTPEVARPNWVRGHRAGPASWGGASFRGGAVPSPRGLLQSLRWAALMAVLILPGLPAGAPPAVPAVRFTVFAPQPLAGLAYRPAAGAAWEEVKFYPTARSPRYEYRGAMPLRFIDRGSQAVVAEATVPAGLREALLLFIPHEAAAGGAGRPRFQVAVLDDGAARHGAGGLAIVNLSGLALSGTVNSKAVELTSGLNPPLPVGRSAKIVLTTVFKQRTYTSYSATIGLGRNERALVILFPPFNKGSLEVQPRLLVDEPPGAGRTPKK
jgi:hypothetical protein